MNRFWNIILICLSSFFGNFFDTFEPTSVIVLEIFPKTLIYFRFFSGSFFESHHSISFGFSPDVWFGNWSGNSYRFSLSNFLWHFRKKSSFVNFSSILFFENFNGYFFRNSLGDLFCNSVCYYFGNPIRYPFGSFQNNYKNN